MKEIVLNGRELDGMEGVHLCFQKALALPSYYGFNLDALYDVLTDLAEETVVTVRERQQLALELGKRYARLMRVLEDAAAENDRLHLVVEKDPEPQSTL